MLTCIQTPSQKLMTVSNRISLGAAAAAAFVAGVTLAGWWGGIPQLTFVVLKFSPMMPGTAAMILLLAIALLTQGLMGHRLCLLPLWKRSCCYFIAAALLLSLGGLLEHAGVPHASGVGGWAWLTAPALRSQVGVSSIHTLVGIVLAGLGLGLGGLERKGFRWFSHVCLLFGFLLNFTGVLALFYNESAVYAFSSPIIISVNTTLALLFLHIGILAVRPERGIWGIMMMPGVGGTLVRWLLPLTLIVVPLLGWVRIKSEQHGMIDSGTSAAVFVMVMVLLFSTMILWVGGWAASKEAEDRRAKAELQSREVQFRTLTTLAPVGIFQTDSQGQCIFVNEAWQEITGVTFEQAQGPGWSRGLHPEDCQRVEGKWLSAVQDGTTFQSEYRFLRSDGAVVWVSAQAVPLIADTGELTGFLGTVNDVTERKRFEAELIEAREAALQGSQAKSEFLAVMSHEIRTPLNSVIGLTGFLLDTRLTTEQREYAEVIQSSGEGLLSIINDILDFSKIEAGKLELEQTEFRLRDVVDEAIELVSNRLRGKSLELISFLDSNLPRHFQGDPVRLRQILLNLLSNAVKFTEAGNILIRVRGQLVTGSKPQTMVLRFEVEDTGIGISPEQQKHLFQSFSQADSTTTRKFGGTGLGLAICKQLAELMGGEIGVSSQAGKGSVFWFTVRLQPAPVPARKRSSRSGMFPTLRALVVVAHHQLRAMVKGLLSEQGFEVVEVENGHAGLDCLNETEGHSSQFHLVVVDTHLADGEGREFIAALDALGLSTRPILLTYGGSMDNLIERTGGGKTYTVSKPVKTSQFIRVVRQVMNQESASGEVFPAISDSTGDLVWFGFSTRLLVAEDNLINQRVVKGHLRKLGLDADIVSNGAEALRTWEQNPSYSLILMDCQMPELDGLQATREIRLREQNSGYTRPIPVVALTADAYLENRKRCLEAGMNDFLTKPIKREELGRVLKRWLPRGNQDRNPVSEEQPICPGPGLRQDLDESIFDRATLDRLQALGGTDPEVLQNLFAMFLAETPKCLDRIRRAVQVRDGGSLRASAHELKGMSANLGLVQIARLSEQLENSASGTSVQMDALWLQMETAWERVRGALSEGAIVKYENTRG
ncbi:MAG: response regulator [Blastocatellia bacterium]|nr:response regulator [Blastocatellia bacterium]